MSPAAPILGRAIGERIAALAAASDEPGRLTRLYLGPAHARAVTLVTGWMGEAGMSAQLDPAGSVVGRYEGESAGAPTLILGSHIDTVRDAGRFDGNLGVLTAIAVVERLHRRGRRLPFAIEVVAFGDEEGVRFASTLGGSRAFAGTFDPAILDETDADGVTRRQALIDFGCDPQAIAGAARDPARTLGYVEVHIEQGPVLEAEGLPLAVVTAINGATRGTVAVEGMSGHAGTVPMAMRRDALAAAAEMILAVEERAGAEPDLVATVGRLAVENSAVNTVAGKVVFSLDVRSPSDAARRRAVADIAAEIAAIARKRGVRATPAFTYDAPAASCDPALSDALAASLARLGFAPRRMPSGAGHDAMAFRERLPFAMLFVRCRGGISHNPLEHAEDADIDAAARGLADLLAHFPFPR